jgi:hypothetical protein
MSIGGACLNISSGKRRGLASGCKAVSIVGRNGTADVGVSSGIAALGLKRTYISCGFAAASHSVRGPSIPQLNDESR